MKKPNSPDESTTEVVLLPADANTLERSEDLAGIIRSRIEAALTRLAPGSARQYAAALNNFGDWFCLWSFVNGDQLTAFLPIAVIGAHTWWTIIGALFRAGPALANEVGDRYATRGCLGLRSATVAQRLSALRWVFRVAEESGLIDWQLHVRGPRVVAYRDTRGPGLSAFEALLKVVDRSDGAVAARDAVMLGLLFVLGLRRGEATSLRVENFDPKGRVLAVVGKGHVDEVLLSIPAPLAEEIERYLALRGNPAPDQPLLASHDPAAKGNGALTGNGLYRRVVHLAKLAGLSRRVIPHGLRHTSITTALDETDGDLRSVRAFARHAKSETTIHYDDRRRDVAGQVAEQLSDIWSRSRGKP